MRLAFLGTPSASVPTLDALVAAGHEVVMVVTQPDRRRGRGSDRSASPVKDAAQRLGLRVSDQLSDLTEANVERAIVVAYGEIIPAALLEQLPMLNVHFSLLPRWRGAAPVERAILAGDSVTGVSIMDVEPTLDTGAVHASASTAIDDKSADELTHELAVMGATLLVEVLANEDLLAHSEPQGDGVTYAAKLTSETFRLAPTQTREVAQRIVRLGKAYLFVAGRRLRIAAVVPSDESIAPGKMKLVDGTVVIGLSDAGVELRMVQPDGGRLMSAPAWWAGARFTVAPQWG